MDELLTAQQAPGNALYHHWLTPGDYAKRFEVGAQDAQVVADWLRESGFTDIQISPSRTSVSFSGHAAQAQPAFGSSIHSYVLDGEAHIANASGGIGHQLLGWYLLPRVAASSSIRKCV